MKVTPPKPKQPSVKTPEKKTPINASDFFGSSSVQRSDRKTVAAKRKKVNYIKKNKILEDSGPKKSVNCLLTCPKLKLA